MSRLKTATLLLLLSLLWSHDNNAQSSAYLGQPLPGLKPVVFAPGLVSTDEDYEFGSVFSKDGTEFFYGVTVKGKSDIRYSKFENGSWSKPKVIISDAEYSFNDPFLSPDETELYFISDQPNQWTEERQNHDIWYAKREGKGWSAPINAGLNINTNWNEYYISFTSDFTMYFSSNGKTERKWDFEIHRAPRVGDSFGPAERLSDAVNGRSYEADVFVSPDENYLIFASDRKGGEGSGDLYISFKQADGEWSQAKNMGAVINTPGPELCPYVTIDGKYFFYTRNRDIYWVSTEIFDTLK